MADDLKKQQPEERPQDELQDEQLSKVNGGGSIIDDILRIFTGKTG